MAVNSAPRTLDCDHQGNPPGLPCPSPTSNGLTGLHYNIQTLIHSIQSSLGFCLYLFIPKKNPYRPYHLLSMFIIIFQEKMLQCWMSFPNVHHSVTIFHTYLGTFRRFEASNHQTPGHQPTSSWSSSRKMRFSGFISSWRVSAHGDFGTWRVTGISWDYHGNIMVSMVNDGSLDWKNWEKKNRKLRKP